MIDHFKSDGNFGVRPVTDEGEYYLNTSVHWPMELRQKVPEELRIHSDYMEPLSFEEIPKRFRA